MNRENLTLILAALGVLVAVVGAVVAVFARRDARDSAAASKRSAKAAEDLTAIEQQREHQRLTPELSVRAVPRGLGSDRVRLTIKLDGPNGMEQLDEVSVRIRDDQAHVPGIPGGPTQKQLDEIIWGPYRLVPGVDDADGLGRAVPARPLARGDSRTLELEPSLPPPWSPNTSSWREQYAEQPIRLEITCARAGQPPWQLYREVDPPQPKFNVEVSGGGGRIKVTAQNVGTAPAHQVRLSPPTDEPMVGLDTEDVPLLDVGERATARIIVTAQGVTWINLTWTDHVGVPRNARVDLTSV